MKEFELVSGTKFYKVDFTKVKSLEDVLLVLSALQITIMLDTTKEIPEYLKVIFDKGFLTENGEEKHYLKEDK